jgi:EpsI family protein
LFSQRSQHLDLIVIPALGSSLNEMGGCMKINPVQAIAASVAIVAAAILAHVLTPRELMAKASASIDLETTVPREFGDWKMLPGVGVVTPGETEEIVDPYASTNKLYSKELGRTYVNSRGQIVMILVAYGPAQTFRLKAHRPEICYAAAGFRISEKFGASLDTGTTAKPINMTRVVTQREARFEPVTYWMRVGNDVVTGVVDRQVVRLKYGLQGLIPDGALVRFSTVGISRDQSFALQDRFIREFLNAIEPSKRPFFAGV